MSFENLAEVAVYILCVCLSGGVYKCCVSVCQAVSIHVVCLSVRRCLYMLCVCLSGGVETVCRNLVYSNRRLINTAPSLISTMMQHLSSAKTPSSGSSSSRGKSATESENTDGMQNFAPLGTVEAVMTQCSRRQ